MKLLVTGGAGFIGSHFIRYELARYDDEIICLDKLTYAGNLGNLDDLWEDRRFSFVRGDIADRGVVEELFQRMRPDKVVNFAAESHVDRSIAGPLAFLEANVTGVGVLLEACRKYGVERFHQVSTDEVYGDLPLERRELLFTEESPLRPSSPYAASKASADILIQAWARTYGLSVTLSRCSNNYGSHQFPEKLIPLAILHALEDQPVPIYGDGQNVRDWIAVEDHCAAVDAILRRGEDNAVYNVSAREERSNLNVLRAVLDILEKPDTLISFVPDRPGHDRRYGLDPSKLTRELGWRSAIPFEKGLEDTVRWYREHRPWLEHIWSGEYRNRNKMMMP